MADENLTGDVRLVAQYDASGGDVIRCFGVTEEKKEVLD
jgi:hypothetical protein